MYGFSIKKKTSMYDGSNTINIQHNLKQEEEEEEEASHANIYGKESELTAGQLTLSYQGEFYVFDSVSPEKVQAALLLLGEYEIRSDIPAVGTDPVTQRGVDDIPGKAIKPQRASSLNQFRQKRKERSFDKKTGSGVRKELALRQPRKNGRFTSPKAVSKEVASTSSSWNGTSGPGQDEQGTLCKHCGISCMSTPMMRCGPAGPKTLCNACGLNWKKKGVLRGLPKVSNVLIQDPATKTTEQQSDAEANDLEAVTVTADVVSSLKVPKDEWQVP